ncbi:MAG: AsmA family protein, partial [Candidatus Omnitrophica bacterium]|nr:AsmA family protein [Candidatus Omnitrophota bacterium]
MNKIVKFSFIGVIFLIFLSIMGVLIFFMTFDIKRFKPAIIAAAGDAVGRQVNCEDIALKFSLKQGIRLHLAGLSIGEDPAFGSAPFFTARQIDLGVSPGELILKRRLMILDAEVKAPEATVIRLKDGRINVQSMAKSGRKGPV